MPSILAIVASAVFGLLLASGGTPEPLAELEASGPVAIEQAPEGRLHPVAVPGGDRETSEEMFPVHAG
ncbi:MAG TPA: hypothetical protein VK420_22595 [Longimicrobium sp.]|nr:hypothetical protein [Longimicrobium sp.]